MIRVLVFIDHQKQTSRGVDENVTFVVTCENT